LQSAIVELISNQVIYHYFRSTLRLSILQKFTSERETRKIIAGR